MRSKSREDQRPSLDVLSPDSVVARDAGAHRQSVIGPDLHIVGTIRSEGNVRIEGHVDGEVNSRALTVGPKAHVIGGVSAGIAEIHGTVEGDVTADTVVTIDVPIFPRGVELKDADVKVRMRIQHVAEAVVRLDPVLLGSLVRPLLDDVTDGNQFSQRIVNCMRGVLLAAPCVKLEWKEA